MWYLSSYVHFISLNIVLKLIHFSTSDKFIFLYERVVFHCENFSFSFPFFCWWKYKLFLIFTYHEFWHYKRVHACSSIAWCSYLLGRYLSGPARSTVACTFSFWRNSILISITVVLVCIATSCVERLHFTCSSHSAFCFLMVSFHRA